MLKKVAAIIVLFAAVSAVQARVIEIRKGADVNPTIAFAGVSGDH